MLTLGDKMQNVSVQQEPQVMHLDEARAKERLSEAETWRFLIEKGYINDNLYRKQAEYKVKDKWLGKPAYIIAAAPMLKPILDILGWDWLDGKHTIGINHTIEKYDGFEWFIFLDKRFLELTTYDMDNYNGHVFFQCNCGDFKEKKTWIPYFCSTNRPGSDLNEGLYTNRLSGTVALNLALIAGANPIYCLGYGMAPDSTADSFHFDPNYTGEQKTEKTLEKFQGAYGFYNHFEQYKHRIIHVTDNTDIPVLPKMSIAKFCDMITKVKATPKADLTVCHISRMTDFEKMGTISQYVFSKSIGKHINHPIGSSDPYPKADLYIVEVFINGQQQFRTFKRPNPEAKVISIIHSNGVCMPSMDSDSVVVLTKEEQKKFAAKGINTEIIGAGVDCEIFDKYTPDYSNHTFGRITRSAGNKIHPDYNRIVKDILDGDEQAKCILISADCGNEQMLNHPRMEYQTDVRVPEIDKKAQRLSQMSLYVHADGGCQETFCVALLEAMAAGLPCIVMKHQKAMIEVLGEGAIIADDINHVSRLILEWLPDAKRKEEYGKRNRTRARLYSVDKMIKQYNSLFERVLHG